MFSWHSCIKRLGCPRLAKSLALGALIVVSFARPIDRSGESQLDVAFTRALIGFGIARTLNGVIAVAQGTEFAGQPAGISVNFAPGEILDPVNAMPGAWP